MPKVKRKGRSGRKPAAVTSKPNTPLGASEVHREKSEVKQTASHPSESRRKQSKLFLALQKLLSSHAKNNPECAKYAPSISKYMRSQFPFFGIKSPPRRSLLKEFVGRFKEELCQFETLSSLLYDLWEGEEREFQNCGVDLMEQFKDVLLGEGFDEAVGVVKHCLVTKSWWDTVDAISYPVIGYFVEKVPDSGVALVQEWIDHENMWLRRVAILHQLCRKKKTDESRLFSFCLKRAHEEEFFIRKAIGWALRDYCRTNRKSVKDFVTTNKDSLSQLSIREALKHCS